MSNSTNFIAVTEITVKHNRNFNLNETRETIYAVAENYEFNVSSYNYNKNTGKISFEVDGEFDGGFSPEESFEMFSDELSVLLDTDCTVDNNF